MFPVISTIHPEVQRTFCLSYILLLIFAARNEIDNICCFTTYHPDLPKVRESVNKHWSIIESSNDLSRVFPEKPIMAYRRPKSLRDLLVHAKLKPDPKDNEPLGGRARCQTCKMILCTQTVKSSSGAVVKLKCDTNCKTANVVYLISCCKCQKQYVGMTKGLFQSFLNPFVGSSATGKIFV